MRNLRVQFHKKVMAALLKDSLQLSEGQLGELSRSSEALFEEVLGEIDPGTLLPIDRERLKREVVLRSFDAIEGILDQHQMERWDLLADFSDDLVSGLFGSTSVRYYGLEGDAESQLLEDWHEYYSLRREQVESLKEVAAGYVKEGRAIVERYGGTPGEINALSPELKAKMDEELLEIQRQTEEGRVLPFLDERQREGLQRPHWAFKLRRFQPGRNISDASRPLTTF